MKFPHIRSKFVPIVALLAISMIVAVWLSARGENPAADRASRTAGGPPRQTGSGRPAEAAKEPAATPAPLALSDRVVAYHIAVKLDDDRKELAGTQTLTWTNPGQLPVKDLYFHLYPNAFESRKTTFMQESGGKLRNDKMTEDSFGGMTIASMKTADGYDLLPHARYVQPDDGNAYDHTLMKVSLDRPVPPHAQITLNMAFTVKLPKVFARMGYDGDFVMAGQWFPKISVYEPAGVRNRKTEGWNLHQYHGNSEFYSDFGMYSVSITVPKNDVVAATGAPTGSPVTRGDAKTYSFYADDVHDFAWAASPHFIYAEEPYSDANIPGLKIKLYLDPLHKDLQDRYFAAVKKSLADYAAWYGEYPYSTLSVVVPPADGNGAGGMEYPTLITSWAATEANPDLELERVIVHEVGHQYWYGMVASNEFEEAWLDEGFTSYAEAKVMEKEYHSAAALPFEGSYVTDPAALNLDAWQYPGHGAYADNVYIRAKLVLSAIERKIGSDSMQRVLHAYFERWKFRHPATSDFLNVLNQVTGENWQPFFNEYVYAGNMTDVAVDGIQVKRQKDGENGKARYVSTVFISKKSGLIEGGVPVIIHFGDGSSVIKRWEGREKSVSYRAVGDAPVDWAMVDPNYSLVLENRHINNFLKTSVDSESKVRWNLGAVKLIEALLHGLAW